MGHKILNGSLIHIALFLPNNKPFSFASINAIPRFWWSQNKSSNLEERKLVIQDADFSTSYCIILTK